MSEVHRDISNFHVHVHLSGSRLTADIEHDGVDLKQNPSALFAFYLVRNGETIWRGRYSSNPRASFRLERDGRYSVRAFVKLYGAKSSRASAEVVYESRRANKQGEKRWPEHLPFTKLDYPHSDFAIVSSRTGRVPDSSRLEHLSKEIGLFTETWQTGFEELVAIRQHPSYGIHGQFIFSGMAKGFDRLVFGQEDIELDAKSEIVESVGDFVSVSIKDGEIVVETDYFGVGKVFYYDDGSLVCVSNRYHLLLLTLKTLGVELSFDRIKARSTLQAVNQPFTQNFTTRMDVKDCYMLPIDRNLKVSRGSIEFVDSEIKTVLDGPADLDPDALRYSDAMEEASAEIVSNLRVALEHPRFDAVRVDLTGGMDARLVFAALTHLTEFSDKVGIHTADVANSPNDLKISLALTRHFPFGYDSISRLVYDQSLQDSVLQSQSMNLGSYYGLRAERGRARLQKTLRVNGFYGEVSARPYFARLIFGRPLENAHPGDFPRRYVNSFGDLYRPLSDTSELVSVFREAFESLPGNAVASKMDSFYLFYRNGLHCSDRWLNHSLAPGWGPLQSKKLFALKWSTFMHSKDVRLQMDVTACLNRDVAALPIGRASDNNDRNLIDPSYPSSEVDVDSVLDIRDDDLLRYQDAARKRSSRSLRLDAPDRHEVLTDNDRFVSQKLEIASKALSALEYRDYVLSSGESRTILSYLREEVESDRTVWSQRSSVLFNKVLSLYYQAQIISSLEPVAELTDAFTTR